MISNGALPPVPPVSLGSRAFGASSPVWRLDWLLLVAMTALLGIGTLLVWSATRADLPGAPQGLVQRHLAHIAIGAVLAGAVALVDHRWLRAYAPFVYVASCVGLLLVLTPLGETINGSRSWLVFPGGFQLQPSEFAKLAVVLAVAMVLTEPRDDGEDGDEPSQKDVLLSLSAAAVPIALVMLQPDLGTTLVFGAITLGMLTLAGVAKRWLFGLIVVGAAGALLFWAMDLVQPYQIQRFTTFTDPSADPRGAGYNAVQALLTVGSGGFFGKGLFEGGQTTGRFVPEQHTDFIFTVAGEELGFLGSITIIALLGLVLWRGLQIAGRCTDAFGALVAGGVVCWLGFQTFVNIGMTLGIMPVTGLPLPLVSYGGSATVATLIAVGLLQAVHVREHTFD